MQAIAFPPTAGRLLRFRVLSTQNPEAADPPVTAAGDQAARAVNALAPLDVGPITLSAFRVLEHQSPQAAERQLYLSDLALPRGVARDRPAGQARAVGMRMNGLRFRKGLGVGPASRIDLALAGNWTVLRADLGVDDSCRAAGGLQFQVWSGARLLYDSGFVTAPAVVKPEIDVRGLREISLRTLGARGARPARVCANWANAMLTGTEGASVAPR